MCMLYSLARFFPYFPPEVCLWAFPSLDVEGGWSSKRWTAGGLEFTLHAIQARSFNNNMLFCMFSFEINKLIGCFHSFLGGHLLKLGMGTTPCCLTSPKPPPPSSSSTTGWSQNTSELKTSIRFMAVRLQGVLWLCRSAEPPHSRCFKKDSAERWRSSSGPRSCLLQPCARLWLMSTIHPS